MVSRSHLSDALEPSEPAAPVIPEPAPPETAADPDTGAPPPTAEGSPQSSRRGIGGLLGETLQIVVPAVLLALVLHIFMAQATVVYGQSMQPNLMPSERLVIEKVSYRFHEPRRADIVVLDLPQMSELLIKRVVALPGETVEIRDGYLWIDGRPLDEPYVFNRDASWYGPITLGPDMYFVMGDNRGNSNDSRVFGPVPRQAIVGRAWIRYWPLNRFQLLH